MCILMGKRLAHCFEQFSFTSMFFVLTMQKSTFFKEKNGFESSFYKIDV